MMLVEFLQDGMIYPKETSIFGSLDSKGEMIKMADQPIYTTDSFGLKTMNEAGKISVFTVDADHLQFSKADI